MPQNIQIDPENIELRTILEMGGPLKGKRVLEIGCGDGRLTNRYADQAKAVVAIDLDKEGIARAKESNRYRHVTYMTSDLLEYDDSEPFDLVLLAWSL